jgi:hypothetical protein
MIFSLGGKVSQLDGRTTGGLNNEPGAVYYDFNRSKRLECRFLNRVKFIDKSQFETKFSTIQRHGDEDLVPRFGLFSSSFVHKALKGWSATAFRATCINSKIDYDAKVGE